MEKLIEETSTLDVPKEYEQILRNAVASGLFATEEAALRHALQLLADQQQSPPLPTLPGAIDIDILASRQGVKPFDMNAARPTGPWPNDESVDDFVACIYAARREPSSTQAGRK